MIERYSRPEMTAIWTEQNKFDAYLKVEILACEAWSQLGHIPAEDVEKLWEKASFNIDRIYEIEKETRHDVVAFTRAVSETLGEEKKWVHYGLTSTDVVDTANGYLLKQANDILRKDIQRIIDVLASQAKKYKHTVQMGRTHGVHAEITTFGLKLALWYEEMKRNQQRFETAAREVEAGKISGAVGTHANIPFFVQDYTCEKLGIESAKISTQTLQRDRHAAYMSAIALVGATIEKMGVEIRHLQRTEVREAEEFFRKGQKGSSAMPHKRNPIGSENMAGCARILRGYMVAAFENIALWHERDISHSSAERIMMPDATILLDYMLSRFSNILENIMVYPDNMMTNINATHGVIFSQRVMLKLIEKGLAREAAYDLVQPKAMDAWENRISFRSLVAKDETIAKYLTAADLDDAFDHTYHLKSVDGIFERLGLE
ncbi:MAG: adenylosuccinate lyase [Turicibacter sp.]|nr:adenylosuccinate lyase [Turicibacter sp.]